MYQFVLIHGGLHDGTAWDGTAAELNAMGHSTWAPTLPGHGHGAQRNFTLSDQANAVVEGILRRDLHDVVLVGHSYGGNVIQLVASQIPERIGRLVFHSATVLLPGNAPYDELPKERSEGVDRTAPEVPVLSFEMWREAYMNDADLASAEASYARLSPSPGPALFNPTDTSAFFELGIPRSVLHAYDDGSMPIGWFHPKHSSRLGLYRLVGMPGGHEVMFTNPRGLAEKLIEAGRP